jgi:putative transposase
MSETRDTEAKADARREVALFRYGLIAEFIHLPPGTRGLYARLRETAAHEYSIPGTLRRRVALETLRGWLSDYRRGGFDALLPSVRADAGSTRSIPTDIVDLLCEVKDAKPELSIPLLIKQIREAYPTRVTPDLPLPESTVHRMLARRGLTRKRDDEPTSRDHRRFAYDEANELWMSDVMYGPKIRDRGRLRQTYLIAFIDDATRLVPFARFTISEGTVAYLPVFEQAIRRRGLPKRLYVDNGAAFRSTHLAMVCAKLGVALIHAKPYSPQGKGKMERWFRTVRMQLLSTLSEADLASESVLNRRLAAWVEGEYHHAAHRSLGGETPLDRWARMSEHVQMPDAEVGDAFLAEVARKVQRDRTVTLDGAAFEVDASLVGETVQLRFDAATAPDRRTVQVWYRGKPVERAKRVDLLANTQVKRNAHSHLLEEKRGPDRPSLDEPARPAVPQGMAMRSLDDDEGLF